MERRRKIKNYPSIRQQLVAMEVGETATASMRDGMTHETLRHAASMLKRSGFVYAVNAARLQGVTTITRLQ